MFNIEIIILSLNACVYHRLHRMLPFACIEKLSGTVVCFDNKKDILWQQMNMQGNFSGVQ